MNKIKSRANVGDVALLTDSAARASNIQIADEISSSVDNELNLASAVVDGGFRKTKLIAFPNFADPRLNTVQPNNNKPLLFVPEHKSNEDLTLHRQQFDPAFEDKYLLWRNVFSGGGHSKMPQITNQRITVSKDRVNDNAPSTEGKLQPQAPATIKRVIWTIAYPNLVSQAPPQSQQSATWSSGQAKGPLSVIPMVINRLPIVSSYYPPFFGWIISRIFGAIPTTPGLLPTRDSTLTETNNLAPMMLVPGGSDRAQLKQWSSPFSEYFPIVINDPIQTAYSYISGLVEYGPSADVCGGGKGKTEDNDGYAKREFYSTDKESVVTKTADDEEATPSVGYEAALYAPKFSHRIKRDTKETTSGTGVKPSQPPQTTEDADNDGKSNIEYIPVPGRRRYDTEPADAEGSNDDYRDIVSSTVPRRRKRQHRRMIQREDKKKASAYDNFTVKKINALLENRLKSETVTRSGSEYENRIPDIGPQISKLVVRKGGVAIAGAGGIATAGSGGTAIVGPGGTAYTTPAQAGGVAMVGPGGKIVRVADTLEYGRGADEMPVVATGAGHNTFTRPDGQVFTSSDTAGGMAIVGPGGRISNFSDEDLTKSDHDGQAKSNVTKEILVPAGARLLTTGPIIYYNPIYPTTK